MNFQAKFQLIDDTFEHFISDLKEIRRNDNFFNIYCNSRETNQYVENKVCSDIRPDCYYLEFYHNNSVIGNPIDLCYSSNDEFKRVGEPVTFLSETALATAVAEKHNGNSLVIIHRFTMRYMFFKCIYDRLKQIAFKRSSYKTISGMRPNTYLIIRDLSKLFQRFFLLNANRENFLKKMSNRIQFVPFKCRIKDNSYFFNNIANFSIDNSMLWGFRASFKKGDPNPQFEEHVNDSGVLADCLDWDNVILDKDRLLWYCNELNLTLAPSGAESVNKGYVVLQDESNYESLLCGNSITDKGSHLHYTMFDDPSKTVAREQTHQTTDGAYLDNIDLSFDFEVLNKN